MGLFDIFKKTEAPKQSETAKTVAKEVDTAASAETTAKGYSGDPKKTQAIASLLAVPYEERNEQWAAALLADLPLAGFRCGSPQIIAGPDGFPYFQLFLPEEGKEFQSFVVDRMVKDFLLNRGYGVVLNPGAGQPDWVLTYGDILNYHLNGSFFKPEHFFSTSKVKEEVVAEGEEIVVGQPSEAILPVQTRILLKDFFQLNGINEPKVMLMMRTKGGEVSQDLVFNITPEGFESEEQYRNMMQTVTWYLPRHYSLVGLHDNQQAENGFMPL